MRQIGQHAQTVHHLKDPFAKVSQSAVLRLAAARAYEVSIIISHLDHPHSQFIKNAELLQ